MNKQNNKTIEEFVEKTDRAIISYMINVFVSIVTTLIILRLLGKL